MYIHKTPSLSFALSFFYQRWKFYERSNPWKISLSKKKKNWFGNRGLERIFESRFSEKDSKPRSSGRVGSAFQSLPLSMHLPNSPPSPPHSSRPVVPLPRGPVSSSSRVRSEHRVSGGRMSEETETHWHRFHTHFLFFYVWNIIKRGKRGGNRLRSSSECRALVTNGRWTDLPLRWPEMRLELESKCFSNVNSFVRSISSFNIIIVLCLLSRVETFFVDINISFLWSIDLSFD